jgi:hypothetical protein
MNNGSLWAKELLMCYSTVLKRDVGWLGHTIAIGVEIIHSLV